MQTGGRHSQSEEKIREAGRNPSGISSIIRSDFASKGDEGRTSPLITVKGGQRGVRAMTAPPLSRT